MNCTSYMIYCTNIKNFLWFDSVIPLAIHWLINSLKLENPKCNVQKLQDLRSRFIPEGVA
jgi:hypothetical protein